MGRAIKGRRNRYTIAIKCGILFLDGQMAFDGSRKHVREFCEGSLKRLGVDYIDLYYLQRVDPNTPGKSCFSHRASLLKVK